MWPFKKKEKIEEKNEEKIEVKKCRMCGRKLEPESSSELCDRCKMGIV